MCLILAIHLYFKSLCNADEFAVENRQFVLLFWDAIYFLLIPLALCFSIYFTVTRSNHVAEFQ